MLKAGDRIYWEYTHYFNSRSSRIMSKRGEYIGLVKHTKRYAGYQLAIVRFDGNKRTSRVPLGELGLTTGGQVLYSL